MAGKKFPLYRPNAVLHGQCYLDVRGVVTHAQDHDGVARWNPPRPSGNATRGR
jgi:hypothetical protein